MISRVLLAGCRVRVFLGRCPVTLRVLLAEDQNGELAAGCRVRVFPGGAA